MAFIHKLQNRIEIYYAGLREKSPVDVNVYEHDHVGLSCLSFGQFSRIVEEFEQGLVDLNEEKGIAVFNMTRFLVYQRFPKLELLEPKKDSIPGISHMAFVAPDVARLHASLETNFGNPGPIKSYASTEYFKLDLGERVDLGDYTLARLVMQFRSKPL
jgi:hypothetical protein